MKVHEIYESAVTGVIGILSGIALTITLFTSPVPDASGWLTVLNNPAFIVVLAILIVGISILAGKLTAMATKCWSDHAEEATFGNRLFGHFGFVGMDKERSIDIRMNDQQKLVSAYWSGNSTFGVNGAMAKQHRGKMGIYASLGVCITTLITGFIYVFTCLKAWGGAFDVGSITQYVGAATAMVSNIFALTDLIGVLETNTAYLDKTFEFLDIPNAMYQGSLTTEKRSDRRYEVEFKDVSFKYPGSDIWALRHVNMKFKVGKRLAIVGENGSGKTTFIKLLCRLYDPQEGKILLNGIDIRKYRYDDYMHIFSVVFQDFQLISQPHKRHRL
jgi:ATP-binding cassette subfamily B protein